MTHTDTERAIERNQFLDITKDIAIICVIITHFCISEYLRKKLLFGFTVDMAVPLFVLISGYVSAASFERRNIISVESA